MKPFRAFFTFNAPFLLLKHKDRYRLVLDFLEVSSVLTKWELSSTWILIPWVLIDSLFWLLNEASTLLDYLLVWTLGQLFRKRRLVKYSRYCFGFFACSILMISWCSLKDLSKMTLLSWEKMSRDCLSWVSVSTRRSVSFFWLILTFSATISPDMLLWQDMIIWRSSRMLPDIKERKIANLTGAVPISFYVFWWQGFVNCVEKRSSLELNKAVLPHVYSM